ncbi:AAA family ATPase [Aestuariirhabdus litorea]|uniref:AAA family ATPase n=1 Tax=Aestuariirhabdus litorea TaxID=2528527 RepID=A0A3P3VQB1_9GAMM|nr:AAA family ATPase [Aestuariirhabdus litorea]RRJ84915.1 AAA family ATPase [Aestuariirhabdus litorea]RWW98693.1 AAA family ATPase [Endozoicomonadaceae bacterium GTF-13]
MESLVKQCLAELSKVVVGKPQQLRLALCCLISRGHLLIEDLPGMGKTTLAQGLARVMGLSYSRIQFTSDLLPADILGVSVYDREGARFDFHPGPVFSQLVLADEINRATPKSQSALLEAMEERQVTIEGETRPLPEPFFVIATQNPQSQAGTFPLPESQLDRFLMRLQLGYPDADAERRILMGEGGRVRMEQINPCLDLALLVQLQQQASAVRPSAALIDYLQRLVAHTRSSDHFAWGLSPRASQALLQCARTWAAMDGRSHLVPEDLQAVLPAVVEHRLREHSDHRGYSGQALGQRLLAEVDVVR